MVSKNLADWYRKNVTSLADRVTARRLMNQGKLIGRPSVGRLNMFFYDPKTKLDYRIMMFFH